MLQRKASHPFLRCNKWGNSFLSLAWEQAFLSFPAFSIAFHEMQPHHGLFSPSSAIAHMGELANPTPSAASNPQLWITYYLVHFTKSVCFLPLLNSIFLALVSTWGWKNKHPHHCCFEIQHGCKTPTDNPRVVAWEGHVLLHRWVSWSEEEIQLSAHLQSPGSAWQGLEKLLPSEEVPSHSMLWESVCGHRWMDYSCSTGGSLSPLRQSYRWCICKNHKPSKAFQQWHEV